jgi:transcriptional regulator with GAF, ATPase, and Fis domain
MGPTDQLNHEAARAADYEIEIRSLSERLERSEEHMARTLMRATRLAQVISVLGNEKDLETTVERAAIELGELFFADIALLILDSDAGLSIAGHWGVAASDLPREPFALPAVEEVTRRKSVRIGPADSVPVPDWLDRYSLRHVAWVRLIVGEKPIGLMLLARRGEEPFEDSEATELRAVAYRVALAIENGLLHDRMKEQLAQLHRAAAADRGARRDAGARRRRTPRRRHARRRGGCLLERRDDRPRRRAGCAVDCRRGR